MAFDSICAKMARDEIIVSNDISVTTNWVVLRKERFRNIAVLQKYTFAFL
jgi:hypothetical protein